MGRVKYNFTENQINELKQALKLTENKKFFKTIQSVLLRAQGYPVSQIIEITGLSQVSIRKNVLNYLNEGIEYITTEKRGGRRSNRISLEEEEKFLQEQLAAAQEGKIKTAKELYHLFLETYEVEMTYSGFWRLLKRHGWSIQTPRPRHPKAADESVQESSKKLT